MSEETLQITEKRSERQRRKERYTHLNAEFPKIARRDKKAFLKDQCKETEENNRINRELFKKIIHQGNISCKDGHNKGQKLYEPNRSRRF